MAASNSIRVAVVAVGTELTTGARLDTNSQWLSSVLSERGFDVVRHATVADDVNALRRELAHSVQEADVVLLTGGLGPTQDDVTREALAKWLGVPLVLHETSLREIELFFARRGRPMPERNRVQALFPRGSEPLPNPIGTAPGIWIDTAKTPPVEWETDRDAPQCRIAAMPGVPVEMKRMFREQVLPRLPRPTRHVRRLVIHLAGIGESDAEAQLGDLTARGRNPEVGITAHEGTLALRIQAAGDSPEECERMLEDVRQRVAQNLREHVFGEGECTLADVVVEELARRKEMLVIVDFGTCGALARLICEAERRRRVRVSGAPPTTAGWPRWKDVETATPGSVFPICVLSAPAVGNAWAFRPTAEWGEKAPDGGVLAAPHLPKATSLVPAGLVDTKTGTSAAGEGRAGVRKWRIAVTPLMDAVEDQEPPPGEPVPFAVDDSPYFPPRMAILIDDPCENPFLCTYRPPRLELHSPLRAANFVLDRFRRLLLFGPSGRRDDG